MCSTSPAGALSSYLPGPQRSAHRRRLLCRRFGSRGARPGAVRPATPLERRRARQAEAHQAADMLHAPWQLRRSAHPQGRHPDASEAVRGWGAGCASCCMGRWVADRFPRAASRAVERAAQCRARPGVLALGFLFAARQTHATRAVRAAQPSSPERRNAHGSRNRGPPSGPLRRGHPHAARLDTHPPAAAEITPPGLIGRVRSRPPLVATDSAVPLGARAAR